MPQSPQARRDDRKLQILGAAHICFGREGIHGTSMRDISEEAGVSVGTLYRYFDGKRDVVRALAEWARLDKEKMVAGLDRERPRAAVAELARRLLAPLASDRAGEAARLEVRLWAEALSDESLASLWRENYEALRVSVEEVIREGQEAGRVRGDLDAVQTARAFLALGQGAVMLRSVDEEMDAAGFLEAATALLDGGLAPGPGAGDADPGGG